MCPQRVNQKARSRPDRPYFYQYITQSSNYVWMVENLNEISVGIPNVKGSGAVPVSSGFLIQYDAFGFEALGPLIDMLRTQNEKPEVIQTQPAIFPR